MLEEKCLNQLVVESNNSGWNTDDLLSLSLAESEVKELYEMEKMGALEGGNAYEQLKMVNGEFLSLLNSFGEKKTEKLRIFPIFVFVFCQFHSIFVFSFYCK